MKRKKTHKRIKCIECGRIGAQYLANVCTGCGNANKVHGPLQCDTCECRTLLNYTKLPRVKCLACFQKSLIAIKDGVLKNQSPSEISRTARVDRTVVRGWRTFFLGGPLPRKERTLNEETVELLHLLRAEVLSRVIPERDAREIKQVRFLDERTLNEYINKMQAGDARARDKFRDEIQELNMFLHRQSNRWKSDVIRNSCDALLIELYRKSRELLTTLTRNYVPSEMDMATSIHS